MTDASNKIAILARQSDPIFHVQDLNHLLPDTEFQFIRKILKQETLMLLKNELEKLIK